MQTMWLTDIDTDSVLRQRCYVAIREVLHTNRELSISPVDVKSVEVEGGTDE